MRIQKQNNISFKQRYLIPKEPDAASTVRLMERCYALWREGAGSIDSCSDPAKRILLLTTGEDAKAFFKSSIRTDAEGKNSLFNRYIQGAVEFGQDKLEQLRSVIGHNLNYRIKMDERLGPKNLDFLAYAVSAVSPEKVYIPCPGLGNTSTVKTHEGINEALVAVRDFEEYPRELERVIKAKKLKISGQVEEAKETLLLKYLADAKAFGHEEAVILINSIRNILALEPITLESYCSTAENLVLHSKSTL